MNKAALIFLSTMAAFTDVDVSETQSSYRKAYKDAYENNKPLVVYVCADWCPECIRMKNDVISKLDAKECVVCIINYDSDPIFARKFMKSNSVPQTNVYWLHNKKSKQYVGYTRSISINQ